MRRRAYGFISANPAGVHIFQPFMAPSPDATIILQRWHALRGRPIRVDLVRRTTMRGVLSTAESHSGQRTGFGHPISMYRTLRYPNKKSWAAALALGPLVAESGRQIGSHSQSVSEMMEDSRNRAGKILVQTWAHSANGTTAVYRR